MTRVRVAAGRAKARFEIVLKDCLARSVRARAVAIAFLSTDYKK